MDEGLKAPWHPRDREGKTVLVGADPGGDPAAATAALHRFGVSMVDYAMTVTKDGSDPEAAIHEAQLAAKQLVEMHEDVLDNLMRKHNLFGSVELTAALARRYHELTFKVHGPDLPDGEIPRVLMRDASENGRHVEAASLMLPPFQIRAMWGARWYECAMPRVVWEPPAYAEQLMVSPPRTEVLDGVRCPWPAFLLDLPRDLIYSAHPKTGERSELTHVLVQCYLNLEGVLVWNFMAYGPSGVELWRHGIPTEHLVRAERESFSALYEGSIANEDELTLQYIGNLIVGTCLTVSDPTKVREAKHTKGKRRGISNPKVKKKYERPLTRNYVVGAPVKVRIREAIQESYEIVRGKKTRKQIKALKLATFVHGFWRNQPYGPKNSLRRPQHIEGFWRNLDKDNPIVVRSHLIEKEAPEK